jgi:hypothetical protein
MSRQIRRCVVAVVFCICASSAPPGIAAIQPYVEFTQMLSLEIGGDVPISPRSGVRGAIGTSPFGPTCLTYGFTGTVDFAHRSSRFNSISNSGCPSRTSTRSRMPSSTGVIRSNLLSPVGSLGGTLSGGIAASRDSTLSSPDTRRGGNGKEMTVGKVPEVSSSSPCVLAGAENSATLTSNPRATLFSAERSFPGVEEPVNG